jgi:hypothetical protein
MSTIEELRAAWREHDRDRGIKRVRQIIATPVYIVAFVSEIVTIGLTMLAHNIAGDPFP